VLGERYAILPDAIRRLHEPGDGLVAHGRCRIERGREIVPRLLGLVLGLPAAGEDVPVELRITVRGGVETWARRFGDRSLVSTQEGAGPGRVVERLGPLGLALEVRASPAGLDLVARGATLLGVPLPRVLAPRIEARERVEGDRFRFEVAVDLPPLGRLIRYAGWLRRDGDG
jgi:Domain of unknown function (DUF4166)